MKSPRLFAFTCLLLSSLVTAASAQPLASTPAPTLPELGRNLAEFGPVATAAEVQSTYENAVETLRATGGVPHWGTHPMVQLDSKMIYGSISYLDWIQRPVEKGLDRKFYVPTVRGLA